jgi:hypothetical protein
MGTVNSEATLPDLDDEETAALLLAARKAKAQRLSTKAYFESINAKPPMPTAEQLDTWVLAEARRADEHNPRYLGLQGFVLDDTNRAIFNALSLYFTQDPRFEQLSQEGGQFEGSNFSLRKGIALFGPVGCGKTTLLRLFTSNPRESFTVTPCTIVANNYKNEGDTYFDYYTSRASVYGSAFRHSTGGRCFDDLGVEPIPVSYYSNKRNMMADVLERRYALGSGACGLTHLTTNLSSDQIDELYGQRIRSRMRELFNAIYFDPHTPDRRI